MSLVRIIAALAAVDTPLTAAISLAALTATVILNASPARPATPAPTATTPHFLFHATEGTEGSLTRLLPVAERRYQALCEQIHACDKLAGPIETWLAVDAADFAGHFRDGSPMAEWAVGVAFPAKRRIVVRAYGSRLFGLHEVFDHEVSHVLLHALAPDAPRWFHEGVAIWQAGEPVLQRFDAAHAAALTDRLVPLNELDGRYPTSGPRVEVAYAQAALFVRWLQRSFGPAAIDRLFQRLAAGDAFEIAFFNAFKSSPQALYSTWSSELGDNASVLVLLRDGNLFWVAMGLLFLLAAAIQVRRRRAALEEMGDDEEAEEAWATLEATRSAGEGPTVH